MKTEFIPPTAEELELIKKEDVFTLKAFFSRNYDYILRVSRCLVFRVCIRYSKDIVETLINECYVNLPKLDLDNGAFFFVSLKRLLYLMLAGGSRHAYYIWRRYGNPLSLEKPLMFCTRRGEREEGCTPGDTIGVSSAEEEFISSLEEFKGYEPERVQSLLEVIKDFLTPLQYICAVYRITTDMTFFTIANEMKISLTAVMSLWAKAKKKLILYAREILTRLAEKGFKKSRYYLGLDMLPRGRNVSVYFAMKSLKLFDYKRQ